MKSKYLTKIKKQKSILKNHMKNGIQSTQLNIYNRKIYKEYKIAKAGYLF